MAQQESRQPPQHQNTQPGHQAPMTPQPSDTRPGYRGSEDSSYMSGQVLHPNGGMVVNG